jgi:hypothetical protein
MENKSQSSYKSFDYEDDDLRHDPFVAKPDKLTKNKAMFNPLWSGILHNRFFITDAHQLRNLNEDLRAEEDSKEYAEEGDEDYMPPAFFSDSFEKAHGPLELKRFKMINEELQKYACKAS